MINKPISQTNLFEFKLIFNEIIKLYDLDKLPRKMLFSGPKGSGKSTLAFHIINFIK